MYEPPSFTPGGKKKTKAKMTAILEERQALVAQIKSTTCASCEQVAFHLTQLDSAKQLAKRIAEYDQVLQGNVDEKEQDFANRNALLTH